MPGAVGPIGSPEGATPLPQPASGATAPAGADFSSMLRSLMAAPRGRVADVRAEIAALRGGGALRAAGSRRGAAPEVLTYPRPASAGGPDPFGWRSLARGIGDSVVAPGFGPLFEQQIAQESGFDPEVAFGLRRSSAGAEGIAQLMPEYYPGVDRTDPHASLLAGAQSMRHYLAVFDGDVRKALASYNAGLGRVQSLVRAHGEAWERGLPDETRRYLDAIVGDRAIVVPPASADAAAVFGGRGPGGVLVHPLAEILGVRDGDGGFELLGEVGALVRAPADGRVVDVLDGGGEGATVVLDHGNGWRTWLAGLADPLVGLGDDVRRSDPLGALGAGGALELGLLLDGRSLDPRRYLLSDPV